MSSNNSNPPRYFCPPCNQTFTVRSSLTRHLATASAHNPPRRFFCVVAGCPMATQGFTRSDEFLTHRRRVHGIQPAANNQGGVGNPPAAPAPAPLAPMAPMAPGHATPMLAPGPVPSLPGPAFGPASGPAPGPSSASASASALASGSSTTASSSATANTNATTSSAPGLTLSVATTLTFAEIRVGLPTPPTMATPGVLSFQDGIAPGVASALASMSPEARNAVLQSQLVEVRRDGQYLTDRYQRGSAGR